MLTTLSSVAALLLGIAIMLLGNGLLGILLSLRTAIEGFAPEVTGFVMSAYYAGLVAGSVYGREVVQRVGHIRAFAACASILSVTSLVHAFLVTPLVWAALRALSGFCVAGLFMVTESWLNARASNENRGRVLSLYMITAYLALGLGQFLLNLADPAGLSLFAVVSILFSLALVPVALTQATAPDLDQPSGLSFRRLYAVSPLGVAGCLASGLVTGALYGMGPIFGAGIGLTVSGVSTLMGVTVLGGLALAWPVGRLSDRYDRRTVLMAMSFAVVVIALAVPLVVGHSTTGVLALAALFGALSFSLYSLSVAYANDYIEPRDLVQASGGLLVAYGVGASLGPLAAAAVMGEAGPGGLFLFMAAVTAALGLFALYRMRRRGGVPLEEQVPYVVVPRTSPAAARLDPRGEGEQTSFDFDEPETGGGDAPAGRA